MENRQLEGLAAQQAKINFQLMTQLNALSQTVLAQSEVIVQLKQQQTQSASASSSVVEEKPKANKPSTEFVQAYNKFFDEHSTELSTAIDKLSKAEKVNENDFLSLKERVFGFSKLFVGLIGSKDDADLPDTTERERELKMQLMPVFQRYIAESISDYIKRVMNLDINDDPTRIEGRCSHIEEQAELYLDQYGEIACDEKAFNDAKEAFATKKGTINAWVNEFSNEQKKPESSDAKDKPKKPKSKGYSPQIIRFLQATTVASTLCVMATTSLQHFYGNSRASNIAQFIAVLIITGAVCFAGFSGKEAKRK